jgi:beclin
VALSAATFSLSLVCVCGGRRRYWRDLNAFQAEQAAFRNERDALVRRHANTSEQLARLRSTNVLVEVFRIGRDGDFGTINGCRLGRLPNQLV